ncbi:Hypothetical protein PBC10988_18510 [Planctomycetales bacterium 10988]|nr:Hypothetical protein PBC10988_18510 [Planctomycetales bacterium 10988]
MQRLGSGSLPQWLMLLGVMVLASTQWGQAQIIVPGHGSLVQGVGDDFEDPKWGWRPNFPKSSKDIDENPRKPIGIAFNNKWFESNYRGQPEQIERVPTPANGIQGSTGAMLMRSQFSKLPGRADNQRGQDEIFASMRYCRYGQILPTSYSPAVAVRVWLPPFDQWEPKSGSSFALRLDVETTVMKESGVFIFRSTKEELEGYWPGIFVNLVKGGARGEDTGHFIIRANERGQDIRGPNITQTGWWTLGMSVSPDGKVHYFVSPGVDDLTREDHVCSHFCYGYKAERYKTFFFNTFNQNDGNWSTPWIVDDPKFYVTPQQARRR